MQREGGSHETTVEVAVTAAGARTTVRFHEERMRDADERAARRVDWKAALERIAEALGE